MLFYLNQLPVMITNNCGDNAFLLICISIHLEEINKYEYAMLTEQESRIN